MATITPCIWFDDQAEAAAELYTSLFDDGKILNISRYGESKDKPAGSVMVVEFSIQGLTFTALNGGPQFPPTEAISLQLRCSTQAEVDRLWEALTANGGEEGRCGWLKDRFGVSWQVIPDGLSALMTDPDPARAKAATTAMMQMQKLDITAMRAAADAA